MNPNCIDVSSWQSGIDWQRVKKAGIKAVIIRAGFGTTRDNQFESHYKGAKAAGLSVGAYWYSYAYSTSQAEQEARACVSVLSGKSFELPVYYDMEEDGQMSLGKQTMTAMACCFIDTVQAAGYRGGMYSSPSWFSNFIDYDLMRKKYSVWLAHWASSPARKCDIWQYGEDGSVDGVPGDCDVDIIMNWDIINGDTPKPDPTPEPADAPTVATVQTWLNENYNAGLAVDSIYGRLTKAALVKALQKELNRQYGAGLAVDGIYGPMTNSAVRNLSKGDTGALVSILQGLLICNGYPTGGHDGIFGYMTEASVLTYQEKEGLEVDGIAGKQTFEALCG